jgi:hypothetical protein
MTGTEHDVRGQAIRVGGYRLRATLRRRIGGYLTLALLLGLVGGVALASVTAARRTDSSYPDFLRHTNPSQLIVEPTTTPAYSPAFLSQMARLRRVRKLESAETFIAATLTPRGKIGTYLITQVGLLASVNGMFSDQDRPTVVRGHPADPARADQVVASTQAAAVLHLHVGSKLLIGIHPNSGSPTALRRVSLTVTGLVVLNTQVVQDAIDIDRTGFLIGTPALARAIGPCCASAPYVGVQLFGGSRSDAAVVHEYTRLLATSRYTSSGQGSGSLLQVYSTAGIEQQAQRAIRPEAIALGVFGLIAGLAALLIGTQSITRQLRASADDATVLRALGAGRTTAAAEGVLGILAAVLAGALLAAAIAVGLSPLTLFGPVRSAEPAQANSVYVDWTVLGLGALVLAVTLAATAIVAGYRLAGHLVAGGDQVSRVAGLVRAGSAAGLPSSAIAGLRFALEPGRGRTAVPVRSVLAGAMLAVIVVMATLTFGASLAYLVARPTLYGWNFSYALYSTDGFGAFPARYVGPKLRADRLVAASTGVNFATAQVGGQTVPVLATPAHAAVAPPVLHGHAVDGPGQIVLGPQTLAQLHQHIGGWVWAAEGKVLPRVRLRIVGTATLPAIGTVLGVHTSMGTGAVVDESLVDKALLSFGGALAGPNAIFVRLRPGVSQAAGLRSLQSIADFYRRLVVSPQIRTETGGESVVANVNVLAAQRPAEIDNYRSMGVMPEVLAGGLAVGAVAGLALTLTASVRRRRRDLALLKTLGFTRRQLATAIAWQASVIALAGLVIGIPAGIAAGRWLWLAFARTLAAVPVPVIPAASIVLAALVALVLANLMAAVPGRSAARTPAALVLRAE